MRLSTIIITLCYVAFWVTPNTTAQETPRPYRLHSVDLKQRVIWGAECRQPDNRDDEPQAEQNEGYA